jgi:L,D-peptidoglycan transpeptidase YkuD (ErfK/YbiS/YcfS/YnhG family)
MIGVSQNQGLELEGTYNWNSIKSPMAAVMLDGVYVSAPLPPTITVTFAAWEHSQLWIADTQGNDLRKQGPGQRQREQRWRNAC